MRIDGFVIQVSFEVKYCTVRQWIASVQCIDCIALHALHCNGRHHGSWLQFDTSGTITVPYLRKLPMIDVMCCSLLASLVSSHPLWHIRHRLIQIDGYDRIGLGLIDWYTSSSSSSSLFCISFLSHRWTTQDIMWEKVKSWKNDINAMQFNSIIDYLQFKQFKPSDSNQRSLKGNTIHSKT